MEKPVTTDFQPFFSVTNSESIDFSSPKIQDIYLSRTGFFKKKKKSGCFFQKKTLPGKIRFSDFQLAEKGVRISSHKGGWFHLASLLRLVGFFSVDIIPAFPIRGYRTIFFIRLRINTYLEARWRAKASKIEDIRRFQVYSGQLLESILASCGCNFSETAEKFPR